METIPPENIKTITFNGNISQSNLPIFRLGERLHITFDDIIGDEEDYYYIITHHNFDWSPSDLSKGEYMEGFDDLRIYNYKNSLNTLQIFSHYQLTIPNKDTRALTKTGNYLLSIYNDYGDIIFSRKFMIIDQITSVEVYIKRARDFNYINSKQIVQFTINSPGKHLINPKQNVKTLIIQNNNLKNVITNLKPQYTLGSKLVYKYDLEASFWGGNEFLHFDNKDVRAATSNIRRVELDDIYHNYLYTSPNRSERPYTYNPDINGNFLVRNISAQDNSIEAEYVWMHFAVQYYDDLNGREIHLYGNFNNYCIDETTKLRYDSYKGSFQGVKLFKQGFYNYKYVLVNTDGSIDDGAISGDFWQTENEYTVLVYYRELGGRYDKIIGIGAANSTNISNN